LALIQYLDVKCYRVTAPSVPAKNVTLSHLNPLFTMPPETSTIGPTPQQLCVPVMKNQQMPPTSVIQYIQYSDVLCYPATGHPLGSHPPPPAPGSGADRAGALQGARLRGKQPEALRPGGQEGDAAAGEPVGDCSARGSPPSLRAGQRRHVRRLAGAGTEGQAR